MAEQQTSFDAAKYTNAQREQWNKDGAAWRRWNLNLDHRTGLPVSGAVKYSPAQITAIAHTTLTVRFDDFSR